MGHEIRSSDRFGEVRSRGERAWHGLGAEIPAGISCVEAFKSLGLDWSTELLTVHADRLTPNGVQSISLPDHRAHVRADTGQVLGLVSSDWKPVDNIPLAEFADAVLGEDAAASCETAGSLYDSRKVFALLRLPQSIVAARGDELATYIAVTNGHGGCAAFAAYPTTVRIVCANTLRLSEKDLSRGARFVHTGDLKGKLATARMVLGFAQAELAKLEQQVLAMVAASPSRSQLKDFFERAFASTFAPPAKDDTEATEKWNNKRMEVCTRWLELFERENARTPSIAGTTWSAFNAVTEWHDHERGRFDDVNNSDARVHSNLFGVSHVAKSKTLRLALAMV
jgi:phage/plasmid-like protein (TIGR03299 family)